MPLAELIKPIEIKDKEGEPAPTELALNYLNQLTGEVESGERAEAVLVVNLLQAGQRYPALSGRLIKEIETDSGPLSVSEKTWLEALDAYLEELGVPVDFLFENHEEGIVKETKTWVFSTRPSLYFKVTREYEPESSELACLRLEIQYRPPGD